MFFNLYDENQPEKKKVDPIDQEIPIDNEFEDLYEDSFADFDDYDDDDYDL